jgi:hypothetical protein
MTCVATADTRTLKRALYEKTLIALSTSNDGRNNVGRNGLLQAERTKELVEQHLAGVDHRTEHPRIAQEVG